MLLLPVCEHSQICALQIRNQQHNLLRNTHSQRPEVRHTPMVILLQLASVSICRQINMMIL